MHFLIFSTFLITAQCCTHFPELVSTEEEMHDIMMTSLLLERENFIELLVMNGFVMKNFLTGQRLVTLYDKAVIFLPLNR